jgi:hypothetical protein
MRTARVIKTAAASPDGDQHLGAALSQIARSIFD